MKESNPHVSLNTNLSIDFLRVVTSFAEQAAIAFGLDKTESLKLTLASEEVFAYLCRVAATGEAITIEASNGGYFAQIEFLFRASDFNPRNLNLTSTVSLDDASSLDEMGLLIASRSVERFYIANEPSQGLGLTLVKEKSYPDSGNLPIPQPKPLDKPSVRTPEPDGLKVLVRMLPAHYPSHLYPADFRFPGKVVDMVAGGEYGARVVANELGQIGGGIIWRWAGSKTAEVFGPYLFNQIPGSGLAELLLDACIGHFAKTEAVDVISRYSTPETPRGYFEPLGATSFTGPDGTVKPWPVYYRQLREDPGCQVWAHPDLESFLKAEYQRIAFTREIQLTNYEGERRKPYSVFAPEFDRSHRQVFLRPIWDGTDAPGNLAQHIKVLKAENIPNIFFEIDLAHAWQASLTPALLGQGFRPRLVLPYGGEGDVVVFQYQEGK